MTLSTLSPLASISGDIVGGDAGSLDAWGAAQHRIVGRDRAPRPR